MDKDHCKERVSGTGRFGCFNTHQCSRKVWKDGFCKTHHPDSVEERTAKSMENWHKKQENTPLAIARRRIKELEAELAELKGEKL